MTPDTKQQIADEFAQKLREFRDKFCEIYGCDVEIYSINFDVFPHSEEDWDG